MEYKFSTIVEKEDKWYVAHCVELQVTSQGKTIEDALENLKDAVSLYLKQITPKGLNIDYNTL
ncbi:type II toxin-antitoxin system HicB family antitoxin [Candidatus Micrarchaeota archaeon]|nr:type II toxin-antitoxin system HicB family antitoxin [Candidatus Micrarchaeota archaeon]